MCQQICGVHRDRYRGLSGNKHCRRLIHYRSVGSFQIWTSTRLALVLGMFNQRYKEKFLISAVCQSRFYLVLVNLGLEWVWEVYSISSRQVSYEKSLV